MKHKILIFIIFLVVSGCMNPGSKSKKGSVNFSFEVNQKEDIEPSYSTAIWLENQKGDLVKTLYVSEYISLGGFNDPKNCPDWSAKANWGQIPREQADAVTGATPMIGSRNYSFNIPKNELPPGKYKYFIEVHIIDNFNELYSGEIEIPCTETNSKPVVSYIPDKHPVAGGILSNVVINCK